MALRYYSLNLSNFNTNGITESDTDPGGDLVMRIEMGSPPSRLAVHLALERLSEFVVSNPASFAGASGNLFLATGRNEDTSGVSRDNCTVSGAAPAGAFVVRANMSAFTSQMQMLSIGLRLLAAYVNELGTGGATHGVTGWPTA